MKTLGDFRLVEKRIKLSVQLETEGMFEQIENAQERAVGLGTYVVGLARWDLDGGTVGLGWRDGGTWDFVGGTWTVGHGTWMVGLGTWMVGLRT